MEYETLNVWTEVVLPAGAVIVGGVIAAFGARWAAMSMRRREAEVEILLMIPRIRSDMASLGQSNAQADSSLLTSLSRDLERMCRLAALGTSTTFEIAREIRSSALRLRSTKKPPDPVTTRTRHEGRTGDLDADLARLESHITEWLRHDGLMSQALYWLRNAFEKRPK